jgi:hypothetical protein
VFSFTAITFFSEETVIILKCPEEIIKIIPVPRRNNKNRRYPEETIKTAGIQTRQYRNRLYSKEAIQEQTVPR